MPPYLHYCQILPSFWIKPRTLRDVPDFFRVAQIAVNTTWNGYHIYLCQSSLWAARQGSANFDGMVYIGVGRITILHELIHPRFHREQVFPVLHHVSGPIGIC